MKISFVVPAYNEELRIARCVESIQKEIERTVDPATGKGVEAEVVVVNNASTDKTKEVVEAFVRASPMADLRLRVVDESHKGLVWARKAGYVATSGELVANVDSDTMLPVGWLARVLKEFAHNKKLVALSGPYIYYDTSVFERILVKIFYFPGWLFDKIFQAITGRATMLQGGNFVIRRDAWDRVGGFDTTIEFYGEDADVARRISTQGRVKWTWGLPMYTSGRRFRTEGLLKTGYNYAINLFATHITGRPYSQKYIDTR